MAKTFVHARLVTPDDRSVGSWLSEDLAASIVTMLFHGEAVTEMKSAYRPKVQSETSETEDFQPHLVVARHGFSDSCKCDQTRS